MNVGIFPFGQPVRRVDRLTEVPSECSSWECTQARFTHVGATAEGACSYRHSGVASEPCIFWRGDDAREIVSSVDVPDGAGSLEPAADRFNGPSGRSIDDQFLGPLGLTRADAWLCDLVPHSCMNSDQRAALTKYRSAADRYGLPPVNWSRVPTTFTNDERVEEIAAEWRESQAENHDHARRLAAKVVRGQIREQAGSPVLRHRSGDLRPTPLD